MPRDQGFYKSLFSAVIDKYIIYGAVTWTHVKAYRGPFGIFRILRFLQG